MRTPLTDPAALAINTMSVDMAAAMTESTASLQSEIAALHSTVRAQGEQLAQTQERILKINQRWDGGDFLRVGNDSGTVLHVTES